MDGDLAEFGKTNSTQNMIFFPHDMLAENNQAMPSNTQHHNAETNAETMLEGAACDYI